MSKSISYEPYNFNFSYRLISVDDIISLYNQKKLIIDKGEWSNLKCSLFIESILIRIPLDFFYINRTLEPYKIISGHNRLYAIKLIILESCKLEGLEFLSEMNGLTFHQLSRQYQRRILEANLHIQFIDPGTPPNIVQNIFTRIH